MNKMTMVKRRRMKPFIKLTIGMVFLCILFFPSDVKAQIKQEGSSWIPDATLVNQLGPELSLEGFRIRPPLGYFYIEQQPGPGDSKAFA